MKAIILAAGRGSRMGDLTKDLPKCRTKFFEKELIDWQLDSLQKAGIKDIAIVTGYLQETFQYPVHYFHNKRWSETNMVMSLMEAKEWLGNDECIISYSDICYSPSPITKLMQSDSDFAICYDPDWLNLWNIRMDDPLSDAESFKIDENSHLLEIGKKSKTIEAIKGQYMGLIKTSPSTLEQIEKVLAARSPEQQDKLDFTTLLNELLNNMVKIKAIPIEDQWYEVDTETDLNAYLKWKENADIFAKS